MLNLKAPPATSYRIAHLGLEQATILNMILTNPLLSREVQFNMVVSGASRPGSSSTPSAACPT